VVSPNRCLGKINVKVLTGLCLIHFIGDFYVSFINPLLPEFVEKFSLSLTEVGLITGISRLLAFIIQPSTGYLADHYRTRFFILGGPLLSIIFVSLIGVVPSFPMLLACVALGSIGSSMYHPTAAGMVSTFSGSHPGLSMSLFNMGGTLAFGLGPLFITFLVGRLGLSVSPLTMILGLAVMIFPYRTVPRPEEEGLRHLGFLGSIQGVFSDVWKPILLIWIISVIRSFVTQAFGTFIPVLCAQEDYSLLSIGLIVSIYNIAGAISGLIAGDLSDRIGYKPIFYASSLLSTISLLMFLYLPGGWIHMSAFFSGFFIMAVMPLTVAMGQELAPRGRSMISSLMMGLAFGAGGMMTPLAGHFADLFSIRSVLTALALLPVLIVPLIYFLPEKRHRISPDEEKTLRTNESPNR